MFRIVPIGKKAVVEASTPDAASCVHCGKHMDAKKESIIWTSQGVKTPSCKSCHDEKKRAIKEGVVAETTIADHEDVHLQSAHDALSARISNHKRDGKDASALEERLKKIAVLIGKKD